MSKPEQRPDPSADPDSSSTIPTADSAQLPPERAALIDLGAVEHNVRVLRRRCAPARLIAVVKADAYGHGAVPVARAALRAGADMLGVAHVREALELREAGIDAPVLAWLHTRATDFTAAVARDVELGVSGWDLEAAAEAARQTGSTARVHLKIDTGLGRNGATARDWPGFVARARALEQEGLVQVVGIFSHLAVADEPTRPETREQLARFDAAVAQAREVGLNPRTCHLANTPGALAYGDGAQHREILRDAVRVGLALYGLSPFPGIPSEELGLRPAMTLQTFVDSVKEVPAGQGVSYGLRYRTETPTTLALIPVGYADGVPRVAEHGPVRIHPAGAPARTFRVVGRVAMDQMVVDLGEPGLSDPALGYLHAPAVLFGTGENPAVEEWAQAAGTINYEIVTRISPRVDRVYLTPRSEAEGETEAADGARGQGEAAAGESA